MSRPARKRIPNETHSGLGSAEKCSGGQAPNPIKSSATMLIRSIAVSLLFAAVGAAQVTTGSLVGSIRDPGGLAVRGATITATLPATGLQRQTQSDERGDFVLTGLEPGSYVVRVASAGFKQVERKGIVLG